MLLPRRYPRSATATCGRTKRHAERRLCRNGTARVAHVILNVGAGEGDRTLVISLEAPPGLKPAKGHSDKFSLSAPIEPQRESRAVRTAGTVSYSEITHLVGGQSGAFDALG